MLPLTLNAEPFPPSILPASLAWSSLMQLHEVRHLKEVNTRSDAEAALADGWHLLAVMPNPQAAAGYGMAVYVLGKKSENWEERTVLSAEDTVIEPRE